MLPTAHSTFSLFKLVFIHVRVLFHLDVDILLLQLLSYFPAARETRRIEHPLLPKWVGTFLAFYDDSGLWDSASWVEVEKIVSRISVDGPNPSVESDSCCN